MNRDLVARLLRALFVFPAPIRRQLGPDGRDIVGVETKSGKPSKGDFERMARRRFRGPKPVRLGKWWYLLSWQDEFVNGRRIRRRKRTKLAPANYVGAGSSKNIAAEVLRPLNQGLISVGSGTKFEDFVASVYQPTVLPLFANKPRIGIPACLRIT